MRKRYIIKIYDIDGTYRKTFNPKLLMNDITFTDKLGGGQGQCVIDLNLPIDDFDEGVSVAHMNVVKVFESDDVWSPEPRLIYTGFVSQYTPFFRAGSQGVRLTCLGLVSMLSLGYFRSGGNYAFTVSDDPAEVIKDIIDHFESVFPGAWLSYSGGFITTVGTTISYDIENLKWVDALKKMVSFAEEDWWWRVSETGQVYLQDRPSTATHLLTIGKDVESGEIVKNNEKIINRYRLTWGTSPVTVSTYEDASSQADYGVREKLETDSDINNSTTADQQGNKVIADGKDPKVEAKVVVNNNYDVESIKPGHTVTIRNAKRGSTTLPANMLITAVQYTPNGATLTLENQIPSLADTFVAAVEAVG